MADVVRLEKLVIRWNGQQAKMFLLYAVMLLICILLLIDYGILNKHTSSKVSVTLQFNRLHAIGSARSRVIRPIASQNNVNRIATSDVTMEDKEVEERLIKLAKENLQNDILIVSVTNYGHRDFALNWILSLAKNGYNKYLLLCFDESAYAYFNKNAHVTGGVTMVPPHWLFTSKHLNLSIDSAWGASTYMAIAHSKFNIMFQLLKQGFTILCSDDDIVFMSPHIIDYVREVSQQGGLRDFTHAQENDVGSEICTGFFLARPTNFTLNLFRRVIKRMRRDNIGDQYAINYIVNELGIRHTQHIQPLDKLLFTNGRSYREYKLNERMEIAPMIIHSNYLVGSEAKRNMLKEAGVWYVQNVTEQQKI